MTEGCSPVIAAPVAWNLIVDGALSGRANMDADARLLEDQKLPGALPVLRFFRWQRPTVSFGRLQSREWVQALTKSVPLSGHQRGGGVEDLEIVQRPTGGGTVRHDKDLSFSLSWRRDHPAFPQCLKEVYRTLHRIVGEALNEGGIETVFYVKNPSAAPAAGLCFVEPAEDDLMWRGKKVVGGALRVTGWGRLYQGNLLTEPIGLDAASAAQRIAAAFERHFRAKPV